MTTSELKMINSNYYNGNSFQRKQHFNIGLLYGTVCYWEKKGIIIFYFANNNVLQDISITKLFNIGHNVKINIYYKYLFQQVLLTVDKYTKTSQYYEYVFCGHSISGAIATIAAYYVITNNKNCQLEYNLITYGSPLVGNKQFSKVIHKQCNVYNYINTKDIIKHVHGYKQVQPPIILNNSCSYDPHS